MDSFEADLVEKAKLKRNSHIESGKPCCFFCKHSRPPNNPEHATHYVSCEWILAQSLPQHMAFGNQTTIMPITAGENCLAFT